MKKLSARIVLHDVAMTLATLLAASAICRVLQLRFPELTPESYASLIFVLAVLLTSRYTHGYIYGILASVLGVIVVNYMFTYPYAALNFNLAGYPLTFLVMLTVALVTCTSTTRLKQQEQARLEAEREKERANLLRAMSHDIRTPLTSILGTSTALLENDAQLPASEREHLLEGVREDAQWLLSMVENLLSVTRVSGASSLHKELEVAEELVACTLQAFCRRFPQWLVEAEIPPQMLMVPMDARLIQQVLTNLLENAVLHSGGTRCWLAVEDVGNAVVFSVRDDGHGVARSRLPHLFDGRLPVTRTGDDGRKNMGIGLSVCSGIIAAHGGRMWAENLPEGGAVFSFSLPVKEE